MSLAEHRAVDVELNAAFARGLKASGKVQHLAFMSSVGADVNARTTGSGAAGMPRYLMVAAALHPPRQSAIYHYPEMTVLRGTRL
jgi:hypothetical protein